MITKIKSNRRFKLKRVFKLKNEGKNFELRKISQLLGDVDFKISNLGYDYDRGLSAKTIFIKFYIWKETK